MLDRAILCVFDGHSDNLMWAVVNRADHLCPCVPFLEYISVWYIYLGVGLLDHMLCFVR